MTEKKLLSKPISYIYFGLIGALFVFCCITGRDLAAQGNLLWTGGYALKTGGISLLAGGALGSLICYLFRRGVPSPGVFSGKGAADTPIREGKTAGLSRVRFWLGSPCSAKSPGRESGISFLLILLAWIPGFLACYPAICAYDMPIQMEQITNHFYIDHHPIAHTLMIEGALKLGEAVFGSRNAGIAALAFLQMAFLAAAFSFGVFCMRKRGANRLQAILLLAFCMLYPFHSYMSVSITKDTIFSAFFVFQAISLGELLSLNAADRKVDAGNVRRMGLVFFISTVGMMLFRNNGKFAFLVFLGALFFMSVFGKKRRRFWGMLLALSAGAFLAGSLALSGIYKAVDGNQGDKREMLSIPIQQLARTMVYHGGVGALPEDDGTMDVSDRALIDDFILNEAYRAYRPDFADPVKTHTNTYVVRYRTKEFLSCYFRLFAAYPGDFVNAALAVDAGYLYPGDESHAWVNAQEGQAAGGGYIQTRWDEETLLAAGIYKDSRWQGLYDRMENWANGNAYLRIPVLKYLFVPGVWIWLYLLLLGWLLLHRKFAVCLPLSLPLGYYLTLLLGPTVQLRYLYPVMILYPFLLLGGVLAKRKDPEENRKPEEAVKDAKQNGKRNFWRQMKNRKQDV